MSQLRTPLALTLALVALLGAGCASTQAREHADADAIQAAVRHGRYVEAVQLADEHRKRFPDDPQAQELHRLASVALLLERGRRATFASDDLSALEDFRTAQELAPESHIVTGWVDKTRAKLASSWLDKGLAAFAEDDLDAAAEAYLNARHYLPDSQEAIQGYEDVMLLRNHRTALGDAYYEQGVRSLAEYWLERARHNFSATAKYQPDNERANERGVEVDVQLADQRLVVARTLEAEGRFFAAMTEYRLASLLDPNSAEAQAGMARTGEEAQARELLKQAEMYAFRKEFGEAAALLDRGAAMSSEQADDFAAARVEFQQARLRDQYEHALSLEHDQRFEDAITAYAAILDEVDYFEDARTRLSTLEGYVEMAASYYARAEAETDSAKKIEHLRAIEGFWPEYKDVRTKIAALMQ
ncbi:MAG: hypothetical protein H6828_01645 [Planctomycetes bacterium]|nr:hypothetical protein [Planctomycetota bacterium]